VTRETADLAKNALRSLAEGLGAVRAEITAWLESGADYNRAAALYETLSVLSDAELRNRGLSRATLAWDLCQMCDRTNPRVRLPPGVDCC
jgi:hypothetical protein